jgi:4a-hydroxytetrahydrobiopterin dehydratase
MIDLKDKKCEPCSGNAKRVTGDELTELLQLIPKWELVENDGEKQVKRSFKFENFADALAFTDKVGEIAEGANHHPEIITEWGKVTVKWWTHKIKGLHLNDFIMAVKTDLLLEGK